MENHAKGDSKRNTYSSEDDEGYYSQVFISTTLQRMSQLNFQNINNFNRMSGKIVS